MFFANVAWGLMAPFAKMAMSAEAISSWVLVSFRVGGAAIAFWIASLFVKKEKVPAKDLWLMVVASILGIILNQGVFTLGISYTSPINASIVTTTLPIITMIIAAFYLKEPITWMKFGGIVVGGSGAVLLILNSANAGGGAGNNSMLGILLCLMAQTCYALYFVLFKNLISKYSPITLMKWMFLFGSIVYIPFNLHQIIAIPFAALPVSLWLQILFVVLGATFFSYMMVPIGQKYIRPTVATMYNNVQPIVASIATVALGMGKFGWVKAAAIVLVFVGVYIVTRSRSRE